MPAPLDDLARPLALLGGLSPSRFMARHWQKKPLLVRQALPEAAGLPDRRTLFELAGQEGVESRLIWREDGRWRLRHGPLARRRLPPLSRRDWTVLVQGVDLLRDEAHALLQRFRFLPDARLDDLMLSWASDGGGVGPHVDSYDVFLLQVQGRRRWRVSHQRDLALIDGLPLKILQDFRPAQEWVLEPGDMLYLPPRWAHEGVAVDGECITASVGFRAPARGALGAELAQRVAEITDDPSLYRDPAQPATAQPARVPDALLDFAQEAVRALAGDRQALACALGEWLTEPKPTVWFEPARAPWRGGGLVLDRRSRMLHDARHVFINGEAFEAAGADGRLMRELADHRALGEQALRRCSAAARECLQAWHAQGWLHEVPAAAGAPASARARGR